LTNDPSPPVLWSPEVKVSVKKEAIKLLAATEDTRWHVPFCEEMSRRIRRYVPDPIPGFLARLPLF